MVIYRHFLAVLITFFGGITLLYNKSRHFTPIATPFFGGIVILI